MAKASVEVVKTITLTLTEAEAQVLRDILGNKVFGGPGTRRDVSDAVWDALTHVVEYSGFPRDLEGEGVQFTYAER